MRDLYSGLPPTVGWSSQRQQRLTAMQMMNANTFFNINTAGFSPTKVLNEKIRARDWDSARIRVLSHPWDTSFRSKRLNNATPLHLACLYRAPADLVQMVLEANPDALFQQDSEGWTPLHVILLYGSDEETALLLIQRGGYRAAAVTSRIVGAPLHLACRHGCSTAILGELLKVNPAMATTANEYSTKPAHILWHQFSRNPENERLLNELLQENNNINTAQDEDSGETMQALTDLIDRLTLLLRAAKGHNLHKNISKENPMVIIHDVLGATQETLGDLTQFLNLLVLLYPDQVRSPDEEGNLPLHNAASKRPATTTSRNLRRTVSMASFHTDDRARSTVSYNQDPVEVLLQRYPLAATIANDQSRLPLHIALAQGQRTWRTGICSLVRAAACPVLMNRDPVSQLMPFQLAALGTNNDEVEVVETILELLLACPHAMTFSACSQ